MPAAPAGAAEISTDFPAVDVAPGDTVTLDLEITSPRRERVGLSVVEAPPNWATRLRGGGFQVRAVTADPAGPQTVQLAVDVPGDAAPGVGRVVVRADASGTVQDLVLELNVVPEASAAAQLSTDFPQLRGAATDTFRFDLTIRNDAPRSASFALETTGPDGWTITARPAAQEQAATVTVEPGSTAAVTVEADPPDTVEAGAYPVTVRAVGEGQDALETELAVEIVGSFQLALTTVDERLDASGSAGDATTMQLLVRNDGTAPLEGVTFSATPPTGWEVSFEPDGIEAVPPGEVVQVAARIQPSGDAVAGDYAVTVTASGSGETATLDLRFAVKTSFGWGLAGILVILGAVAVLVVVFRRFGRR